jgi:hypothetical protein
MRTLSIALEVFAEKNLSIDIQNIKSIQRITGNQFFMNSRSNSVAPHSKDVSIETIPEMVLRKR